MVTGDLTCSGEAHEFENASSFLSCLARRLGLHISQIVVIPGNHDIEWRHEKEKKEIDPDSELGFHNFCDKFYKSPPNRSFTRIHTFVLQSKRLITIGLNSCRIESFENAGLGYVGRKQLALMEQKLPDPIEDELRIALIHHHLIPVNHMEEIDWETKRTSLTLDSEGVIRALIANKVKIVLHGHQHQPFIGREYRRVSFYSDTKAAEPYKLEGELVVIGSGSVGVSRQSQNLIARNAYGILDFSNLRDSVVSVRTRVSSSTGPGFETYDESTIQLPP